MARSDEDTQKFFDDISRQAVGVARDVSRGQKLPESVAKRAVGTMAHKLMEKDAAAPLDPLHVFSELGRRYGTDWHNWEPETLWQTTREDGALEPTDEARNLVMALQVIAKTNFAFEDWHIFEKIGHALAGDQVHFGQLQPLELDSAALEIRVLKEIRPGHNFDSEISGYLAACAKNSGVVYLPPSIFPAEAQEMLDALGNDLELKMLTSNRITDARTVPSSDEAVNVQVAWIREIESYVKERLHG